MPTFAADQLVHFVQRTFYAAGATEATSQLVAESLVASNLGGHDSHGVIRVVQYLNHIHSGDLRAAATPRVHRETSVITLVDGDFGFGQAAAHLAMTKSIEKAGEHGLAAAGLIDSQHVGRLGEWVEMAANAGLIGLAFCNGGGPNGSAAPFGGMERRLGTNPVAAAIPVEGQAPVVIDFATSATAEGKLRVARNSGKSIPAGWIIDAQGQPSTDPHDFYNGGMLLPAAGHKGYGLSLLVELLGGILTGNGAPGLPGFAFGNGVFFQVIAVDAFRPKAEFLADSAAICARMKSTRPAPGFDEVLLPGEPEARTRAQRLAHGIPIDEVTWQQIVDAASAVGVTWSEGA